MEIVDEDVLRLANELTVETTVAEITGGDAVLLGGVTPEERAKLLERACFMRVKLDLLIKQLASAREGTVQEKFRATGTDTPVGIESRRIGWVASDPGGLRTCGGRLCGHMSPALWSALPKELLQMVFARMPFPQISQHLRLLSKEWQRDVTTGESALSKACAEANPKMFAMVNIPFSYDSGDDESGISKIRLYDIKANVWHSYVIQTEDVPYPMSASGGLVCYVSKHKVTEESPLRIVVCNPLTGQGKALPPHSLRGPLRNFQPKMIHLVMNPDTKCYQVIVVVDTNGGRGKKASYSAKIYSSELGAWSSSRSVSSCIVGSDCRWGSGGDGHCERLLLGEPCAFDCAKGQFLMLAAGITDRDAPFKKVPYAQWALLDDHLFVLHNEGDIEDEPCYCISEYQAQTCKPFWVKLRVHECDEFGDALEPSYEVRLDACRGFLMVTASNYNCDPYKHKLAWLYDLSTSEWKAIAANFEDLSEGAVMCDLQWDAVP